MRNARDMIKDLIQIRHALEAANLAVAMGDFKHGEKALKEIRNRAMRVQVDLRQTRLAIAKLKKTKKEKK